jgi:hypothetical protein
VSDIPQSLSPQDALVALMVAVSFSDGQARTAELVAMENLVNNLPIFAPYDADRIGIVTRTVADLFAEEEGLDALFGLIRDALAREVQRNRLHAGLRHRARATDVWARASCGCCRKSATN